MSKVPANWDYVKSAVSYRNHINPHIKIIEVTNARYLYFIQKDGKKEIIDLNTKKNPCGLFIFDGQKAPQLADMTNIETELGFYFAK